MEPCTLRQIRHAERELEAAPALVIWAELSVVAHLIGEPMPVLTSGLLDALARFDPRHRECSLSQAIDAAVAVRTPTFATQLSPDELAVHVNRAMNACVNSDAEVDAGCDWRRWRIKVAPRKSDRRLVLHGVNSPSNLETAVGCRTGDPGWPGRLARALEDFVPFPWPRQFLVGSR